MTKNIAVGANQQLYNINKRMKVATLPYGFLHELQVVGWWSGLYISKYKKKKKPL